MHLAAPRSYVEQGSAKRRFVCAPIPGIEFYELRSIGNLSPVLHSDPINQMMAPTLQTRERTLDPILTHLIMETLSKRAGYQKMMDLGFPIVDNLYWDNPSPMIGSWFMMQLMMNQGDINIRPERVSTKSLAEVVDQLKAEDQSHYWYRGQASAYEVIYRGKVPRMLSCAPMLDPFKVTLESIMPTGFRPYCKTSPADWQSYVITPPIDAIAGPVRAVINAAHEELDRILDQAIDHFLFDAFRISQASNAYMVLGEGVRAAGTTLGQPVLDLISLAQHYEYESIMIDVTKDIDMATWFATTDWETGKRKSAGGGRPGVIYRFDAAKFDKLIDMRITGNEANAPPEMMPFGAFGISDISQRFSFLERPRKQSGGSLLGMENMLIHLLMNSYGAIDVFPFDHSTVTDASIGAGLDDVRPDSDEGLEMFRPHDRYSGDPILREELKTFLDRGTRPGKEMDHILLLHDRGVI